MPFIVTTKRPLGVSKSLAPACKVFRHAVATLEEDPQSNVRDEAARIMLRAGVVQRSQEWARAILGLNESGGSVGPLPDGTIIEVEAATWVDLTKTLHPDWMLQAKFGLPGAARAILAAWNAEQLEAFNAREAER